MTNWKMSMNKIVAALVFVAWGSAAFALNAPDTPLVTGPSFQQTPAAQILVTPAGGAQTTLGAALASGGSVTVPTTTLTKTTAPNTFSQVTAIDNIPIGGVTPSTVAATTLSATGNISQSGTAVLGTNITGSVGQSSGPAIVLATSADPSTFVVPVRNNQYATTLTPSTTSSTIWENNYSSVTLNGPGAQNAEVNAGHQYIQVNSGATFGTGENNETSFFNNGGTVNSAGQYTALFNNGAAGTVTQNIGLSGSLTNSNSTAGAIGVYKFISFAPMSGGGSVPTNYSFLSNTEPNASSSLLGKFWIGTVGVGQSIVGIKGTDNLNATWLFDLENAAGTHLMLMRDDGSTAVSGNWSFAGTLTATGLSAGTQVSCLGLSSANVVVTAACGGGGGSGTVTSIVAGTGLTGGTITTSGTIALDLTAANTFTNTITANPAAATTGLATTGGDASGSTFGIRAINSATQTVFSVTNAGVANISQELIVGLTGTNTGNVILEGNVSGSLKILPVTGTIVSNKNVFIPNPSTSSDSFALIGTTSTFTAVQTFTNSDIKLLGSSTGATTFTSANAGASNFTITVPAVTDTLAVLGNLPLTGTTGSIGGGALLAGACTSGTVAVTGATTSMAVVATPVTYPTDGFDWAAYVSTAGTVTVKVCGLIAGTPTASTYNVRVLQ